MENKKTVIVFIFTFLIYILNTTKVNASTIFFDTFHNGYDTSLWNILPNLIKPLTSEYGIKDSHDNNVYGFFSVKPIPNIEVIKFDVKINSAPSGMLFTCKDSNQQTMLNEKGIILLSDGTAQFRTFVSGGGNGSPIFSWNKSEGIHHIELDCLDTTITIKEDDIELYSWDDGYSFAPDRIHFIYTGGDSEFANYILCDTSECSFPTPTPTPTPIPVVTPTPEPSPSPTLIPTLIPTATVFPTPIIPIPTDTPVLSPVTKVILIPGFGGSMNIPALVSCNSEMTDKWTNWSMSDQIYKNVTQALQKDGYKVFTFYYDWRKQPLETADKLSSFINSISSPNEKIHIISHSMGGQIARAYIEKTKTNSKISKLITVGTPHQGLTTVYNAWSGAIVQTDNPLMDFGILLLEQSCRMKNKGITNQQILRQNIPSLATFLPVYPFLVDIKTNTTKDIDLLQSKNPWLLHDVSFLPPYYGITIGTLSGQNISTTSLLKVKPPTTFQQLQNIWIDGKTTNEITEMTGDGLVRNMSSTLPQADNRFLTSTHQGIITSKEGIHEILSFLGTPAHEIASIISTVQNQEDIQSVVGFISSEGEFNLTDDKKSYSSTNGAIIITNHKKSNLEINFPRKYSKGKFYIIQTGMHVHAIQEYEIQEVSSHKKILQLDSEQMSSGLIDN